MPREDRKEAAGYGAKLKSDGIRQRMISFHDRDIGRALTKARAKIDQRRRKRASASPEAFAKTYFATRFKHGLTDDQRTVLQAMQDTIKSSGTLAVALPRSSGKTQMALACALWATLFGVADYVVLVGANDGKAKTLLAALKLELTTNAALIHDFPDVCLPAVALAGIANRAQGQLCDGQPTLIEWGKNKIVFPWITGSPFKGTVIEAASLLGSNIRGSFHPRPDGVAARPKFIIVDDHQTARSAKSRDGCDERERIIRSDILLAGGPGERFAVFVMCTVIRRNDAAARLLDRHRNPEFNGIKKPFVYAFPTATKEWEAYNQLRVEDLRAGRMAIPNATAFYRAHRQVMDAGAKVASTWLFKREKGEISAIQHAMNFYFSDPVAFACEYQQEPPIEGGVERPQLDATKLLERLNGLPRGRVPLSATKITCMIDVQHRLLYWLVAAWDEHFSGSILDYGTFPDQGADYFTLKSATNLLDPAGDRDLVGIVFDGLSQLVAQLSARMWLREDDIALPLERILIDAKDAAVADAVFAIARHAQHSARVLPAGGRAFTLKAKPMAEWKPKPGELKGDHWVVSPATRQAARQLTIDSNHWRSALARGLRRPLGSQGAIGFWGLDPRRHRMLIDHLTAETCDTIRSDDSGRVLEQWTLRPGRPDNHLWDCAVGAMCAASLSGSSHLPAAPGPVKPVAPRERVRYLNV